MKRRLFIKRLLQLGGLGFATGMYSWQVEPFWLEFVERDMPLKGLPPALEGKTLMQISDMHVGNRFDWHFIIRSLQRAQQFEPDIVVYTGDYVSYEDKEQFQQLETVLAHRVKGKLGTLAILGNHDYGKNWQEVAVGERIKTLLEDTGLRVLRNEAADIAGLRILGLDDYWGAHFQPERVLRHYEAGAAHLALCHNPDVVDLPIWGDFQGWILSGHTHGGQVKPPFLKPPLLPVKNEAYTAGAIDLKDGRQLYINQALGHLWQVRFNVRPEITIFTLRGVA